MSVHTEITGIGIISSIGNNISEFSDSLRKGRSGISFLTETGSAKPLDINIGAEIKNFSYQEALSKFSGLPNELIDKAQHIACRSPFTIQASIISALQAWQHAQLDKKEIQSDRIGLVIAGHNTTTNYQYQLTEKFSSAPEYLSPRYATQFMDSNQIGILSEIFHIQGEGFVTGGASASGNIAIIQASRLIQSGIVDACLVVGVVADLSPLEIQGFYNIGAMGAKQFHDQPQQACRPFDQLHEGFIYGQASASILLESAKLSKQRDVPSLATIRGGSIVLDAHSSPKPDITGEIKAMQKALLESNIPATKINYLNTHGSSSPLGDNTEIEAIEQLYGNHFPHILLNATKGLTGHCIHSSGIVEIITTTIQMQDNFVHPNINLQNPINTTANFCGQQSIREEINIAMSNSFGFGGINSSIVLQNNKLK